MNPQSRIPVVFRYSELPGPSAEQWYVKNLIARQLYVRDLFDYKLPINNDIFFFGRTNLVDDLANAARSSQNRGLFGLRKTGKTSVLYKIRTLLSAPPSCSVLLYDCKLPSIRNSSYQELLQRVIRDLDTSLGRAVPRKFDGKHISDHFVKTVSEIPQKHTVCVIFDEIEYISPLATLDRHWRSDFIPFWQTLWSAQSEHRQIAFMVAGVNPTVVERDSFDGVQNPVFGIIKPTYLTGFDLHDLTRMVSFFGQRMGISFDDYVISNIYKRYGGHPLLSRLACSYVHTEAQTRQARRPFKVALKDFSTGEAIRDEELAFYCGHIVSELRQFYPDEYEMLEMLAAGSKVDFRELSNDQALVKHLKNYGLVTMSPGQPPEFAIPVVGRYIGLENARRQKGVLRRAIIPEGMRSGWLERRKKATIRDLRNLQNSIEKAELALLFKGDTPPEVEKFLELPVVTDEHGFVGFVNVMHKSFVEAVEKFGKRKSGKGDYFWTTIKGAYPVLWEALHRIKLYRHDSDHLELNANTKEEYEKVLRHDLEGRRPEDIKDGWFILQQILMDELFLGIQCELDRFE